MVLTENNYETSRRGSIEVICGSMFSGKTEELIRRLKRAKIARQKVEIFKPAIDVRYSEENIVSHDSTSILSTPVDNSHSILLMASGVDVVGIDEAQFFDDGIVEVCSELANNGTLLLDEIGEMPMTLQSKLLRVLQEQELEHVGGPSPTMCTRCTPSV